MYPLRLLSQTGAVASVRYSRLSRVRRQLGYNGPAPDWIDADKIAVDANYMAVDIVINYAADDLVPCSIQAVVDLMPPLDPLSDLEGDCSFFTDGPADHNTPSFVDDMALLSQREPYEYYRHSARLTSILQLPRNVLLRERRGLPG